MSMRTLRALLLITGIILTFVARPDPPGLALAWIGGFLMGSTRSRGS